MRVDGRQPGRLTPNRFHEAAWIIGPEENLRIADDVWIGAFCVIDALHDRLTIGEGSVIACGAHLYTHSTVERTATDGRAPLENAPTSIGHHVSVCAQATVLMGCTIGHHSVVAAGAVVRERTSCPPYRLLAGVPARIEGEVDSEALLRGEWRWCRIARRTR